MKPLVGKRMELATFLRDSGVGGEVGAGYRSEGLSRCSSAPLSLQFSLERVNGYSDWLKRRTAMNDEFAFLRLL